MVKTYGALRSLGVLVYTKLSSRDSRAGLSGVSMSSRVFHASLSAKLVIYLVNHLTVLGT